MSRSHRAGRGHPRSRAAETPQIPAVRPRGSVLASRHGVRSPALALALLSLPGCLVTETRDIPPRNQPPLILSADLTGSVTTATDAIFLVSETPDPLLNQRRNVPLSIDVEDPDDTVLEYRVFVIAPTSSTGFDGGVSNDGGTAPSGFERRLYSAQRFPLAPQRDRASNRGTVTTILVPGDEFLPAGRCYGVEVRVSAAFRGAADDPYATDKHLPLRTDDLSTVLYWVASYGPSDTSVDLATCPVHTR